MISSDLETGLFSLYLGPKSSLTGSQCTNQSFICVDFLSQFNSPFHSPHLKKDDILWDGRIDEINTECNDAKSKQLDVYSPNPTLHWSTFNEYNDKQVIKLQHCNNFEGFYNGSDIISSHTLCDEFEDKIRYQVEKTSNFRGFVNVYDTNSGFGGLLSKLFPLMDDVFGQKQKLTFGIGDETPNLFEVEDSSTSSTCSFLNYKNFKGKFRGLLNEDTDYHTSAIVSLFINQTLRHSSQGIDFGQLMKFLTPLSRNILTSFVGVPFDDPDDRTINNLFSPSYIRSNMHPLSLLSREVTLPLHHTFMSCCGIPNIANNNDFFSHLSGVTSDIQVFSSATKFCYSPSSLCLSSSFPQFFNDKILANGKLRQPHERVRNTSVQELPILSMLQNSNEPVHLIEKVLSKRVNVNEHPDLIAAGVMQDDISEIRQHLNELLENYTMS